MGVGLLQHRPKPAAPGQHWRDPGRPCLRGTAGGRWRCSGELPAGANWDPTLSLATGHAADGEHSRADVRTVTKFFERENLRAAGPFARHRCRAWLGAGGRQATRESRWADQEQTAAGWRVREARHAKSANDKTRRALPHGRARAGAASYATDPCHSVEETS